MRCAQNYADAIAAAGRPADRAAARRRRWPTDYLDRIDALVVTGGAFDVDPALYGDGDRHATVTLKEGRTAAELALTQRRAGARHAGARHLRRRSSFWRWRSAAR